MDNLTISIIVFFTLFVLTMLAWFFYKIYEMKKENQKIVDKFINSHKKKEEG